MYSSYKTFLTLSAIILALAVQFLSISAHESIYTGNVLQKRQSNHILEARQAPTPPPNKDNNGQAVKPGEKPNPVEEAAGQLIGMLLQTSEALDAVTHMGSNSTIVKLGSDALIKMLPELKLARQKVMKEAKKNGDEEFDKKMTSATGSMIEVLKGISAKPEDCNFIKANFQGLVGPFNIVIAASEGTINLALPEKAAEFEKEKLKAKDQGGLKKETPGGK